MKPQPLPIGTEFDGQKIVDVVDYHPNDPYMPYQYQLEDGTHVWIPQQHWHEVRVNGEIWSLHTDSDSANQEVAYIKSKDDLPRKFNPPLVQVQVICCFILSTEEFDGPSDATDG